MASPSVIQTAVFTRFAFSEALFSDFMRPFPRRKPPFFAPHGAEKMKQADERKPSASSVKSYALRGLCSDSTLYLTRTETTGTNVNRLGCSVNNSLDLADIRLPRSVRLAVRVRNIMTEGYALVAYAALCHVNYTSQT